MPDTKPDFVLDSCIAYERAFNNRLELNFCDFLTINDEAIQEYCCDNFSPDEVFTFDILAKWAKEHQGEIFGYIHGQYQTKVKE